MRTLALGGVAAAAVAAGAYFMFMRPTPDRVGDVRLATSSDTLRLVAGGETQIGYTLLASDRTTPLEDPASVLRASGDSIILVSDNPSVVSIDTRHPASNAFAVQGLARGEANIWPIIRRANGDSAGSKLRTTVVVGRSTARFEAAIAAFNEARVLLISDSVSDAALRARIVQIDSAHGEILRDEGGRGEDLTALLSRSEALVAARTLSDSVSADTNTIVQDKYGALSAYLAQVARVRSGHGPTIAADSARLATLDASPVGTVRRSVVCRGYPCDDTAQAAPPSSFSVGDRVGVTVWFVRGSSGRAVFLWRRDGAAIRTVPQTADTRVADGFRLRAYQDVRDAGTWELRVLNGTGQLVLRHAFTVTAR